MRIWTNFHQLSANAQELREKLPHNPIIVGPHSGKDPRLAEVDVAFGQPDPQQIIELPNLRWVHLNTAGYTRYDREDLRAALRARGAMLTNSSGVYSEPCAQHVLAMILSMARGLPRAMTDQHGSRAWRMLDIRAGSALLNHQRVLLVGFGSIGRRLAELLRPLEMDVIGFRRTIRGDESVPMFTMDALDSMLGSADHIVNLLPSSKSNTEYFNADRFRLMKHSAFFYNIGRGDTVDQVSMRTALDTRSIAGAYIDVTMPEPLPADDPLWTTVNCCITPHSAGGHADEVERVVQHFVSNLTRLQSGHPLRDRIE